MRPIDRYDEMINVYYYYLFKRDLENAYRAMLYCYILEEFIDRNTGEAIRALNHMEWF